MSTAETVQPTERPTLHPDFVPSLVRTFEDSQAHGVHLLFNKWWQYAPAQTIADYLELLRATPGAEAFLAARHFAEPLTLDALAALPEGSVARSYHRFLTDNGLEQNLATNYRGLHEAVAASGKLDAMPEELAYAILRGFQIHDLLHVLTGYTSHALDELALQAFCLAQLQFPYFGMWMSTVTTRMTFLTPKQIVPLMDALTRGWQYGRAVENLQFERWEDLLAEPLAELRPRYGIAPEGLRPAA